MSVSPLTNTGCSFLPWWPQLWEKDLSNNRLKSNSKPQRSWKRTSDCIIFLFVFMKQLLQLFLQSWSQYKVRSFAGCQIYVFNFFTLLALCSPRLSLLLLHPISSPSPSSPPSFLPFHNFLFSSAPAVPLSGIGAKDLENSWTTLWTLSSGSGSCSCLLRRYRMQRAITGQTTRSSMRTNDAVLDSSSGDST